MDKTTEEKNITYWQSLYALEVPSPDPVGEISNSSLINLLVFFSFTKYLHSFKNTCEK